MKRVVISLILILTISNISAQSYDDMVKRYSSMKGAEELTLSRFMLGLARMAMSDEDYAEMGEEAAEFFKNLRKMSILDLGECSASDKARFTREIKDWVPTGFEKSVMDENEFSGSGEKDGVRVFMRYKNKNDLEIITIDISGKDCMLCYIHGKFNIDELENIARMGLDAGDKMSNSDE